MSFRYDLTVFGWIFIFHPSKTPTVPHPASGTPESMGIEQMVPEHRSLEEETEIWSSKHLTPELME